MKKSFSALLILFLCLLSVPSLADKRNAFEFCDLYQSRLCSFRDEKGVDATHGTLASTLYTNSAVQVLNMFSEDNVYNVHLPIGIAKVSVPMFEIEEISSVMYNLNASDDDNFKNTIRSMIMLSALEYSGEEDLQMEMLHRVNQDNPSDAVSLSYSVFMEHIGSFIQDNESMRKLGNSHRESLVYSGQYDYYLKYTYEKDRNYRVINLIARSRE